MSRKILKNLKKYMDFYRYEKEGKVM